MTKRFRLKYMFWLNMNNQNEAELADIIDDLKANRGFSSAIRDGLRIVWELRRGDTSTLYRLFPFLNAQTPPGTQDDLTALLTEFKQAMTAGRPPTGLPSFPTFDFGSKSEVKIIENEEERKALSVKNTLAALEDF